MAAGCLGLIIIGISSAAHHAAIGLVSIAFVVGIALGWLLIRRHAGHPAPMLPIDLFRLPIFALSAATAVCSFVVQGMAFVALPFYFQETLHRTAVETGLFMTPWPLVVAIMAPIAGRLSDRYPAGILGGIGLALLCLGMGLLATLPAAPATADIVWRMALCGCGFGFFQAPNLKALMSSAPPAPQRQRQQHRGDGASHRTNHRCGAGRILLQPRRPRWRRGGAGAGRGSSRGRQPDELPAPDRDPATGLIASADARSIQNIPSCSTRFFFFERCQTTPGKPFSGTSGSPVQVHSCNCSIAI